MEKTSQNEVSYSWKPIPIPGRRNAHLLTAAVTTQADWQPQLRPEHPQAAIKDTQILRSCSLRLFSRFWANHSTSVNQSFLNQGESFHFLTFPYRSAPKRPHLQVKPHHHFSDSQHTECPFWVWGTPTPQLTPHEAEPISLRRS